LNNTCSITYKHSQIYVKTCINVIDVIFKFGSPKRKTHKVHMNNSPSKAFKKYAFGPKWLKKIKIKIATHMDLWKYGQILTIQKSLTIKRLRFSKKRFLIWVYHLVLHYILSPNNKFGMRINIYISYCDVPVKWPIHIYIYKFQKSITINKRNFYQ